MDELIVWGCWRQIDGGMRYALDNPETARECAARLRRDPALADSMRPAVLAETDGDRLIAYEWPGRQDGAAPPWAAIRTALRGAR